MASPRLWGVVVAACLLLAGCDSGGRGTAAIGGVAVSATGGGEVPVEFVLVDAESDPVDVELRFSVDGGATWSAGTTRSPLIGLASSPAGVRHTVLWDALADLGARAESDYRVSVRPTESQTGRTSAAVLATGKIENLPDAAKRVEAYMIHFGPMDAAKVAVAETHDLVILYTCHPSITREVVAEIQDGVDALDPRDDVMVLGYVNAGEDDRTIGISDDDLLLDPRFVGDGSGPRLDPRGAGAAGQPLTGIDPLGLPSVSSGYASFYLDDNSLESNGVGDGKPDRNGYTGACYVNMGDPAWYEVLDAMQCQSADARNGFRELLTVDYGLGLGCDGVFLDNVDTCGPNFWTGPGDPDQAEFEWTAPGYATLVDTLRVDYPDALIMQNRGLFFFHPSLPHYEFSTRSDVDFVKLESYRLDRLAGREFDAYTFADNKFNWGPKLQAEAYRDDGFQILSLGYAEGPGIDHGTLLGTSTAGLATMLQDIVEAQELAGYRHYMMDAGGQIVNGFVSDNADFDDRTPPVWTSTYNVNDPGWPTPPSAPQPRVGIQQVIPGVESAKVRWDVALDLNPVRYVLYYHDKEFEPEKAAEWFEDAARLGLRPETGFGYESGASAGIYAYEAIVSGLEKDEDYWFAIRAVDSAGNEDGNEVVLSVATLKEELDIRIDGDFDDWKNLPKLVKDKKVRGNSAGPDWKEIKVTNDAVNLYIWFRTHEKFNLDGSPHHTTSKLEILLDADDDPFTGFGFSNVGSELMVHGDELVAQSSGVEFGGVLQTLAFDPVTDFKESELAIPLARVDAAAGGVATRIRLIFRDADTGDLAPDRGYLGYDLVR